MEALALINHTIAQQNLYSGDILFALINEILTKHDHLSTDDELYNSALDLINKNNLLARNFLKY